MTLDSTTPNLSFIGIVDFSQEARWIFMTESVTDLLGYEPRDLVGRPSLELVHPDEFFRVRQLHYDTIRQDKAAVLVYLRMKHKDPLKGYVLCGVSRTVVHDILIGSVSFANPNKALQNASTAQEITVIAPEAHNFQFRRWHDPSPMPPSPIPERMRNLPQAFLDELDRLASQHGVNGGVNGLTGGLSGMNGGMSGMMGGGGGAVIEYVNLPDRSSTNGRASYSGHDRGTPESPPPPTSPPLPSASYRSPTASSAYDRRTDDVYHRDDDDYRREYDYEYTRSGSGAHTAQQESYARRRSPSYVSPDPYDRDREREQDRRRDYNNDYPTADPGSPVYTPASPYSAPATLVDSRRRLSGSSSSSGSGTSDLRKHNGSNGRGSVESDLDVGGERRLGHSTSWTRSRIESATPTPRQMHGHHDDGACLRGVDRDVEMERGMARDIEEEERIYRERQRERDVDLDFRGMDLRDSREGDRDRDLATNRYSSPPSSASNGTNGHGQNGTTRHSTTPSPPRSGYSATANGPSPRTYASVTRGSPPQRHYLPPMRTHPPPMPRYREPSPEISYPPLPAQSCRTAFILDRFTDKSSIMYCSNTLLVFPTTSAGSASSSPTTGRSGGSPLYYRGAGSRSSTNELAQANAIGRPFFDFVAPWHEQLVRDWIACVKGWGVNEKGQPSDGGFGFGRFGLVKEGRESAPRNPDPAPRGGRNRRGSMSGGGRTAGTARRGTDMNGRRRNAGNTAALGSSAGGRSPPHANSNHDPERDPEIQRQRLREAGATIIEVDAIFSAHSDGLMVILRYAS